MNRSKRPMTAQLRKKMRKALRSAANQVDARLTSEDIKPEDLLSTFRPRKKKKGLEALASIQKTIQVKKQKTKKVSKRTTPGRVDEEREQPAASHFVHVEGIRWSKTLQKQTLDQNKSLSRKLSKKRR
ncbi:MAG: hypothetical protein JSR58_04555 [Verrucomicrobia bacterium]|nr:hypothetical protein [Verrucomicrobiota bacterium]